MPARRQARSVRRLGVRLAAVPLLAVLAVDAALVVRDHAGPPRSATTGQHVSTRAPAPDARTRPPADRRVLAVRALLRRRSAAVLHHDRRQWLATIDPRVGSLRATQRREFDDLAAVPFASWSYSFARLTVTPTGHGRVWRPENLVLHYRLRGFDRRPVDEPQQAAFVNRGGRWFLTELRSGVPGQPSLHDLWEFGPVRVVRGPGVLVLGHPASLAVMAGVRDEVERDLPRVTAVWGTGWSRRAVVLVPATQRELALVSGERGPLGHIAAVTTAEVQTGPGLPNPVGDRVAINPGNWARLSALGRQVVLTHELTHVATRAVTSVTTPKWLAEGFADYVGYRDSGVPVGVIAQELAGDVRAGRLPRRLPGNGEFGAASARLSQAYEEGWLACRLIVARHGERGLVRFYRAVGTSAAPPRAALDAAARRVLGEPFARFVREWRAYVVAQLG